MISRLAGFRHRALPASILALCLAAPASSATPEEGSARDASVTWTDGMAELVYSDEVRFDAGLTLGDWKSITYGPLDNPVPGAHIRYYKTSGLFRDGNLDGTPDRDHVVGVCYNCAESGGAPEVPWDYSMRAQWEMTYAPYDGTRVVEHNWNFLSTGNALFRPFLFYLDTDRDGAFAQPWAKWTFMTNRSKVALHINQNGNVSIGGLSPQPTRQLEVRGDAYVQGNFQLGSCPEVTAAGSITVKRCGVVKLRGTKTINRVYGCDAADGGRVLHVMCGSDPTKLCDGDGSRCGGGNLRLAGSSVDFVCSPDDVVSLVCNGTNWLEVGASIN
jgi:hypothetical protein